MVHASGPFGTVPRLFAVYKNKCKTDLSMPSRVSQCSVPTSVLYSTKLCEAIKQAFVGEIWRKIIAIH